MREDVSLYLQLFTRELCVRTGIFDHGTQSLFHDLSLENLLLNCSSSQETVNVDTSLLTVSPNPGHSLDIMSGIPVQVKEDKS